MGLSTKEVHFVHTDQHTHDWLQQLEAGNEIGAIFFDFKKAFDRVPHQLLMSKLMGLGLDPYILTWLHNYLVNRRQSIIVNGTTSESSRAFQESLSAQFWVLSCFSSTLMT